MIEPKEKPCKGYGTNKLKYSEEYMTSVLFGNWKPTYEIQNHRCGKRKQRAFNCVCVCGKEKIVLLTHLVLKKSKGCGCKGNYKTTHNLSDHNLYHVWGSMKARCYNKNRERYCDWGGRGIIVCDEWKDNFQSFYDWSMINGYSKGLQIDRRDNDGNYHPDNCQWVTPKVNSENRRTSKKNKYVAKK